MKKIIMLASVICLTFLSGCAYLYDIANYKVKFVDGAMKGTVKVETMPRGYSVGDTIHINNSKAVVMKRMNGTASSLQTISRRGYYY